MTLKIFERRQVLTIALGLILSTAAWLLLKPWDLHHWMIDAPLGRDFVNFWLAPRLVRAGQAAVLVDFKAYGAAIAATFGLDHDPKLLFVYPPHALLFFTPLSYLPFLPAVLAWTAINLVAMACTVRLCCATASFPVIVVACLSPPAMAMMMYGHFGGLLALGATLTIVAGDKRPWLAGLCLACLTVKPQFAAALGLILLLSGYWRCLVVAALGTTVLVALSVAFFGWEIWHNFLTVTMPVQSAFITSFQANVIGTSVTPYFVARFYGAPAIAAWALQAAVSLGALAVAVSALRGRSRGPATILVVVLAALVMQPYVAHYDLAVVAPALTLIVLARGPGLALPALIVWLLTPLALLLYVANVPILGVFVPLALFTEAMRRSDGAAKDGGFSGSIGFRAPVAAELAA